MSKPEAWLYSTDELDLAQRLAIGIAVAWPLLSEIAKTTIVAQANMQAQAATLAETKAKIEAFVAAHSGDNDA